ADPLQEGGAAGLPRDPGGRRLLGRLGGHRRFGRLAAEPDARVRPPRGRAPAAVGQLRHRRRGGALDLPGRVPVRPPAAPDRQPPAGENGPGPRGEPGMEDETEVIRHQMTETRTSLSEKLDKLEDTVLGTVQDTTSSVVETVQSVKEAVEDTVSSVTEGVQN